MKSAFGKYLFAFFAFCYFGLSSGVPVYLHYCGGHLKHVSYFVKTNSCCGDQEPDDDSCCSNEGLVIRSAQDIQLNASHKIETAKSIDLFSTATKTTILFSTTGLLSRVMRYAPPDKQCLNSALSITVLRI